jgi:hypothetical protein
MNLTTKIGKLLHPATQSWGSAAMKRNLWKSANVRVDISDVALAKAAQRRRDSFPGINLLWRQAAFQRCSRVTPIGSPTAGCSSYAGTILKAAEGFFI